MAGDVRDSKSESLWRALDPHMQAIQTAAAVVGVIIGVRAASAAKQFMYPCARPVKLLYRRLRAASRPIEGVKVTFALNPYDHLTADRAMILLGRNQEGKTTLLRTSIPSYRRWTLGGFCGIYLNGAKGMGVDSFKEWQTTQMFGLTTAAGSEIDQTLVQYRDSQWFRLFLEAMTVPIQPKPVFVIVDQFEELLKRYPVQALNWANTLTNQHTRDGLARVIFVVNSESGAQTLLNLNQGTRFTKVVMEPVSGQGVRGLDVNRFQQCQRNIGLYKMVGSQGLTEDDDVKSFVEEAFDRWRADFQVPYPMKYDRSWRHMFESEMKNKMKETLEAALRAKRKSGEQVHSEEVKVWMDSAVRAWRALGPSQILDAPEDFWVECLMSAGVEKGVAVALASDIKRMLGNPVPKEERRLSELPL